MVTHKNRGVNRQMLLKLYRTLIQSKLVYGNFIYQSARKSYLKTFNSTYHEVLRLAIGAFKTSVESLYEEANKPPPKFRLNKLALQYYIKLKTSPSNLAYNIIFKPKYRNPFQPKENHKILWIPNGIHH